MRLMRGIYLRNHSTQMKLFTAIASAGVVVAGVMAPSVVLAQTLRVNNVREIHQLYSENELAAMQKYDGKYAIVSGRVDRVDGSDLIIEGDGEFGRLFCKFSNADINKVVALRNDDRVTVTGTFSLSSGLFGLDLKMHDCRVN